MALGMFDWIAVRSEMEMMTVTDWGCGQGNASQIFENHPNLHVTGLNDIAENSLDKPWFFDRFEAKPLHEATPVMSDLSYNADVLEHVPEDLVLESIENIVRQTKLACFFNVSVESETYKGVKTHITVRPPDWWQKKLVPHAHEVLFEGMLPDIAYTICFTV